MLTVLIPVFNEQEIIAQLKHRLIKLREELLTPFELQLIIVDDGSSDKSPQVLKDLQGWDLKIIQHQTNRGRTAALNTGFVEADGDIVLIMDADIKLDSDSFNRLVLPIVDGEADVVFGSKFLETTHRRVFELSERVVKGVVTLVSNIFSNLYISDIDTCCVAIKKPILDQIKLEGYRRGSGAEMVAKMSSLYRAQSLSIFEVGLSFEVRRERSDKFRLLRNVLGTLRSIVLHNDSKLAKSFRFGILSLPVFTALFFLLGDLTLKSEEWMAPLLIIGFIILPVVLVINEKLIWKSNLKFKKMKAPRHITQLVFVSFFIAAKSALIVFFPTLIDVRVFVIGNLVVDSFSFYLLDRFTFGINEKYERVIVE